MINIAHTATISDQSRSLSAGELEDEISILARSLRARGLRSGDRVLVIAAKSIELAALILAVPKAGGVAISPHQGSSAKQLRHIVIDADPTLAVIAQSAPPDARRTIEGMVPTVDLADLLNDFQANARLPRIRPEDAAVLIYTSGSTGPPKGVVFTNRNLSLGAESVARFYGLKPSDRVLCLLPFSFDAGLNQLLSALVAGSAVHIREFVLPHHTVEACRDERITVLTGVPALWRRIAEVPWPDEARSAMRLWATTGGHMPVDLSMRLDRLFPAAKPVLMYGFTEAFRGSYLPAEMFPCKPTSIGVPIPHAGLAVVRGDGQLCGPNEVGEIVQFGPLVSGGYWNRQEETRAKFAPISDRTRQELTGPTSPFKVPVEYLEEVAWSGDEGFVDEDGCFYFEGRATALIKSQGFRVSPGEIEEACLETGLVEDVVAFGFVRNDDEVIAVVGKPATKSVEPCHLREALRPVVPSYQMPGVVLFRPALPLTPNGKHDLKAIERDAVQQLEGGR